ncbi:14020_t:CDS:2 [Ambispora leptoticha]|uniref:Autophagy-related protein n=1 Tax=Ambispora leptoticha TaxID=144679 RepID=A0A9N8YM57_9GLOM|nr:14020_t:CDS:2 [Ambispora leptoticha]
MTTEIDEPVFASSNNNESTFDVGQRLLPPDRNGGFSLNSNSNNNRLLIPRDYWWILSPKEPITTYLELFSWKFYAFGAEVYSVISLSFMGLILERLASQQGVITSDYITPCTNSTALIESEEIRCAVKILGHYVDTAAFSMYTFSSSVLLQAITAISIGAVADHGTMRKFLLLSFSFVGSVSTMLFLVPTLLLAFVAVLSNVCFGASFVCLNGFLPVLVRNHPDVRKIVNEINYYLGTKTRSNNKVNDDDDDLTTASTAAEEILYVNENMEQEVSLLNDANEDEESRTTTRVSPTSSLTKDEKLTNLLEELTNTKEQLSSRISLQGFSWGYLGGIILLSVCLLISMSLNGSIFSLQIGVFLTGAWWCLVTLAVSRWLPNRPGPPLKNVTGEKLRWFDYVAYSWEHLWLTVKEAKNLTMAFRFLIAWFLLSDGYTTISSASLLFAQTTLQVPPTGLIFMALITPISALLGTIIWPKLQTRWLNQTTKQTVITLVFLFSIIPMYGCLGFILPIGGLKSASEMYVLAVLFGFLLGSIQGYCRTLFSEFIPRGRETEFFALYAVTDKGSSWLGPMLVAIITDVTHEIRYGFLLLLVLILLPIPIIHSLDVQKGREEASSVAETAFAENN